MGKWFAILGLCLLTACVGADAPPPDRSVASQQEAPISLLEQAKRLHFAGLEGDLAANQRAVVLLRELLASSPQDPLILAYFGSARLLQARAKPPLRELYALSQEGLSALDRAVTLAPQQWEVRFLRGMACRHLPAFFDRAEQSVADLALVAEHAEKAVEAGQLGIRLATAALYHHGLNLQAQGRLEAAKTPWRRALQLGPDTPGGQSSARRLADLF